MKKANIHFIMNFPQTSSSCLNNAITLALAVSFLRGLQIIRRQSFQEENENYLRNINSVLVPAIAASRAQQRATTTTEEVFV